MRGAFRRRRMPMRGMFRDGLRGRTIVALAIWLGIQVGALSLSAGRFAFWSHAPPAGEQMACAVMVVVQSAGAALLMPALFEGAESTLTAIALAWPFAWLATALADATLTGASAGESVVSLWMLLLACWRWAAGCCGEAASAGPNVALASCAASLWCIGGPILMYLQAEFAPSASLAGRIRFGPAVVAVTETVSGGLMLHWLIAVAVLAVPGGVILLWTRRRKESGA